MKPELLQQILERGTVEAADGSVLPLRNHVKPVFLPGMYDVARSTEPRLIVEIGMSFGVSSLVLAQALADTGPGGRLISVDPFEDSIFRGIGRLNVVRSGLDVTLQVVTEPSYLVLPRLIEAGERADLVFIDGNHTRDYVRTDTFLAHRLVRVGGVVGLDDTPNRHIAQLCRDLLTDYHYEEVTRRPAYGWPRRVRHRLARAIGFPRHPRVRYFKKLDEHEPT